MTSYPKLRGLGEDGWFLGEFGITLETKKMGMNFHLLVFILDWIKLKPSNQFIRTTANQSFNYWKKILFVVTFVVMILLHAGRPEEYATGFPN